MLRCTQGGDRHMQMVERPIRHKGIESGSSNQARSIQRLLTTRLGEHRIIAKHRC